MQFKELEPLLEKVMPLKSNDDASDIYRYIHKKCSVANTPSMAQSACEHIMDMCHPRAWGDRYVSGYPEIQDWVKYLSELRELSMSAWNEISKNNGAKKL